MSLSNHDNKRPRGPFALLTCALIASELLLGAWILSTKADTTERIVAGSLSIAVLIAFLVVFCVVYWIKMDYDKWERTQFPNAKPPSKEAET